MKTVVIEQDSHSLKYDNTLSICRALIKEGLVIKIWDSNKVCLLDMLDELKPDLLLHHSRINQRVQNKINEEYPQLMLFDTAVLQDAVIADTASYMNVIPHPTFTCDHVLLLEYPDIEDADYGKIIPRFTRIFGVKPLKDARYCGWLPKEYHPVIFSSASIVFTLNRSTAANALLYNKEVVLGDTFITKERIPEYTDNISYAKRLIKEYEEVQSKR